MKNGIGIIISIGKSGGFELKLKGQRKRLCLWWIAFNFVPVDGDYILHWANQYLRIQKNGRALQAAINELAKETKNEESTQNPED